MYDFRNIWAEELDKAWDGDHAKSSMPDWVHQIIDRAAVAAMGRVAVLTDAPNITDVMISRALQGFDCGTGDPNDYKRRMRLALEAAFQLLP